MVSSTNGVTWASEHAGNEGQLTGIAFGSNTFVAVGYNGAVLTSAKGSGWIASSLGSTNFLTSVTYGNGVFVALSCLQGQGVKPEISFRSLDGTNWTGPYPLPFNAILRDPGVFATFGAGLFVVTSPYGSSIATSSDGVTWTSRNSGLNAYATASVFFGPVSFVASAGPAGPNPAITWTVSSDGVNWTPGSGRSGIAIAYGDAGFWSVGSGPYSENFVFTSADGINWTARELLGPKIRSVSFANGTYLVVGAAGTILQSTPRIISGVSQPFAPSIQSQPASQTNFVGASLALSVIASGAPSPSYQWQFNGTNIPNAISSTLPLLSINTNLAGSYRVIVSNQIDFVTNQSATLTVFPATLANAFDKPNQTWTTGGAAPWIAQGGFTHDGNLAGQSGVIPDNQESWIETTVVGPGALSFWWRLSSYYDNLQFYINGSLQTAISGEVDWQQRNYSLPPGVQTLRWRFRQDSYHGALDRGWLDQVVFSPATPYQCSLSAPQRLSDGTFQWTLIGEPGTNYLVQTSTNLSNWNDLKTVVPTSSSFQITDTNAPAYPRLFYRLRIP